MTEQKWRTRRTQTPQLELKRPSFLDKLKLTAASRYRRGSVRRDWRLKSAAARHGTATHLKTKLKNPIKKGIWGRVAQCLPQQS
jgi:hypothetical protein